jgi:hypothetical protein
LTDAEIEKAMWRDAVIPVAAVLGILVLPAVAVCILSDWFNQRQKSRREGFPVVRPDDSPPSDAVA